MKAYSMNLTTGRFEPDSGRDVSSSRIDTGFGATVTVRRSSNTPGDFVVSIDPIDGQATALSIDYVQAHDGQVLVGISTNASVSSGLTAPELRT